VYCEADRNYSRIYLNEGRVEELTHILKHLYGSLHFDPFYRVSRSLLINLDYLVKADRSKKLITLQTDDDFIELSLSLPRIRALERLKE